MTKKVTPGRFLRNAGMGFATLCFAGLLATGAGCLPAASNDTSPSGGSTSSSTSSGGGGGSNSEGGSSSSSSSESGGSSGGNSSSSSSDKAGSSGGSSSSSSKSSSASGGSSSSSSSDKAGSSGGGGSSASSSAAAGSSGSGLTGTTVTFSSGKAVGAMSGYGWIAYGTATESITEPTCGTEKFTSATKSCAATTWGTKDSLCMTATIPALDKDKPDYTANWGVMLGVDSTDAKGSLGQSFSSVTIAVTGSPSSGLRAKVHLKGDAEGTDYCQAYASGALSFTSFTKTCYDTASPGTAITAADVAKIDQIGIQVPSGSSAIDVKSLCITGITFK